MSTLKLQSARAGDILRSASPRSFSHFHFSPDVVGRDCPRRSASTSSTKWKTRRLSLKRICVRGCVILKSTIVRQWHWIREMVMEGNRRNIPFILSREIVSLRLAEGNADSREKLTGVIKIMKTDKSIKPKRLINQTAWTTELSGEIKFHLEIFLGIARDIYIYIFNAGLLKWIDYNS